MFYKFLQIIKSLTERERRLLIAASIVFVVSAIALIFVVFYQGTTASPVEGGSYTEGVIGQPIAINPLIAGDNDPDKDLIVLLFASLIDLAESYKSDDSGKVWTIVLKEELKWSDGKPLTSADVVFTITTIQDPEARSPFLATWQGVVAERLSEREIRLSLKNPYAFFLDNLKNLRIAPEHVFNNIPPQNFRLSEFNLKPVASGPYKFSGLAKKNDGFIESYSLSSNRYYALKKSYIKNFTFKFFVNRLEAIEAFNAREIDGLGSLDAGDLASLKINLKIISVDRPRYYAIFFNQSTAPTLKEKDVRIALNLATDRAKIVAGALLEKGTISEGPIPPSVAGYDKSIYVEPRFSLEESAALLEKSGWKLAEDGMREKVISKNKVRLEFDLIVPETKFLIETAKLLQEDWKKIGVNLNPVILKLSDVVSSAIKSRNYQMILFGNTLNNNPDAFSFWHSSQRFDPGLNLALYSDKTADSLLESLRQNLSETARLQELSKLQKIINDAKPAVFLYSPKYLYATSKNLGGFSAISIAAPANRFEKVNEWYLKTARVFK